MRYRHLIPIIACVVALVSVGEAASAEPLVVGYIERPAYAWSEEGKARGLFVDIARDILARAAIDYRFEALPPKRMLKSVKEGGPICLLGNFKTPEREAYAVFTKPIFQNRPIGVLITKDRAAAFARHKTLAELTASTDLRMGLVDGFSYGAAMDAVIGRMAGPKIPVGSSPSGMISMLVAGRFDYMLADHEEWEALAHSVNVSASRLDVLSFPDLPEGNKRYLMCSKSVPGEVIERINRAIGG